MKNPPPADTRKRPDTTNLTHENAALLLLNEGFEPTIEAAREAVDREREEAHADSLPPESAAAFLVASGRHETTEEALSAVYEKRGIVAPRVARVFVELGPIEEALSAKVAEADATLKKLAGELASARSRPLSIVQGRESHRLEVETKGAKVRALEEKDVSLAARRRKTGDLLSRKLGFAQGFDLVIDAGVVAAGIDIARAELAKLIATARSELASAQADRDAFESKHAADLEPIIVTRR